MLCLGERSAQMAAHAFMLLFIYLFGGTGWALNGGQKGSKPPASCLLESACTGFEESTVQFSGNWTICY